MLGRGAGAGLAWRSTLCRVRPAVACALPAPSASSPQLLATAQPAAAVPTCSVARAEMTLPRADSDLLMAWASLSCSPTDPDFFTLRGGRGRQGWVGNSGCRVCVWRRRGRRGFSSPAGGSSASSHACAVLPRLPQPGTPPCTSLTARSRPGRQTTACRAPRSGSAGWWTRCRW